jgi:hypothetical protein
MTFPLPKSKDKHKHKGEKERKREREKKRREEKTHQTNIPLQFSSPSPRNSLRQWLYAYFIASACRNCEQ